MLVSVEHNFVFLCTPKCASNSIHAALTPYSDISISHPPYFKHTNYRAYSEYIEPYIKVRAGINSIETVCLVREPISWLYSWYRFRSRFQARGSMYSTAHLTFSEFIEGYMLSEQPTFAQVGSQFHFVKKHDSDEVGINKVFAYENLDGFLKYMSQKIDKELTLERLNASPGKRHKSIAVEFADKLKRKLSNVLKINYSPIILEKNYGLSEGLMSEIRDFQTNDFKVYEKAIKRGHEPNKRVMQADLTVEGESVR